MAAALARFCMIDVVVNNIGYGQMGGFEEIDALAIEQQFAPIYSAPFTSPAPCCPPCAASAPGVSSTCRR
ncbi:hypothetical protein [Pseudomonas sp. PIC25]|uniref:hypothetical protein n=1 Tax=Pseudomonas sp. PIC25 TaxID=1958773 RepID=UPI00211462BE|nr:hypothetical protein [Pseudomonas sp. PIC25]